jgi:hypothetical protein
VTACPFGWQFFFDLIRKDNFLIGVHQNNVGFYLRPKGLGASQVFSNMLSFSKKILKDGIYNKFIR